jgi:hypothetical protein
MRRILPALALSTVILAGACQNPDGSTNWGNTLLVGAGVGAAAALVAGAATDSRPYRHAGRHGYRGGHRHGYQPASGYPGYRYGGYRGW